MTGARVGLQQEAYVVRIVQYKQPLPYLCISQPASEQLKYVCSRVRPSGYLELLQRIPHSGFEARRGGMKPEDPGRWRRFSYTVRISDR